MTDEQAHYVREMCAGSIELIKRVISSVSQCVTERRRFSCHEKVQIAMRWYLKTLLIRLDRLISTTDTLVYCRADFNMRIIRWIEL